MKGIYNFAKAIVGNRIREAREGMNYSRSDFCNLLSSERETQKPLMPDTLKQWEYGTNAVSIEWIPAICKVLDCDVGFLFAEYKCKHHETADASQVTGLSESAIEKLTTLYRLYGLDAIDLLSSLICQDDFLIALANVLNAKEWKQKQSPEPFLISDVDSVETKDPNDSFVIERDGRQTAITVYMQEAERLFRNAAESVTATDRRSNNGKEE